MIALVTGANSEIGLTICNFLLKQNYEVIACYHENDDRLRKINDEKLTIRKLNLENEEEINNLLETHVFNLIVNAAAYYEDDYYQNISKADFMKSFEINVVAPFLIAQKVKMNNGIIINISSTDGIDTYNELTINYAASKAALNNLTKSLAYSLKNIKVYALALGWVNTEFIRNINQEYLSDDMRRTKQKRLVELEEIEKYIDKILKSEYKSGAIIRIDGEENVY